MKSTIKLLVVIALMVAGFSQYTTASAGSIFKFRGQSADAFFSSVDPSGCTFTDVGAFPSEGVSQSPPGPGGSGSGVGMFISVFDACTGTQLLAADGFASLADPDFQVFGKLNAATLNAEVPMFDYISGTPFNVSVNLVWIGGSDISRQSFSSHFQSPGCKVYNRFRGTFRSAVASGTVSDGSTNFTPEPSLGASIASVRSGDMSIGCN